MSKYLEFREVPNTGLKTKVISVDSKSSGERLGTIKWHNSWRCYTLWPVGVTIWNRECLDDIIGYIDALMEERKK